jgi:hypothetical protein
MCMRYLHSLSSPPVRSVGKLRVKELTFPSCPVTTLTPPPLSDLAVGVAAASMKTGDPPEGGDDRQREGGIET